MMHDMRLIYLAAPYTSDNATEEVWRAAEAAKVARHLLVQGFHVFAPTVHGHAIDIADFNSEAIPYEHWVQTSLDFLLRSDLMYVLNLPGWKESRGVQGEIEYATLHEMPILLMDHITYKTREFEI